MKSYLIPILAVSALTLSGCVTQQQADAKMGKGCEAAIATLIGDNKQIVTVKATNYSEEQTEGSLFRRVTIDLVEKDGWAELDKQYSCLFAQEWGLFKSTHSALLEQVVIDEKITGKKDGQILGNLDEFMNLVSKVDTAMTE
jgi:hypothetical protein